MCSYLAPILELTTWNFAIDSIPLNLYFIYLAVKFKQNPDAQSSRKLFRFSLIYLPTIILLMLITKYPLPVEAGSATNPQQIVNSNDT